MLWKKEEAQREKWRSEVRHGKNASPTKQRLWEGGARVLIRERKEEEGGEGGWREKRQNRRREKWSQWNWSHLVVFTRLIWCDCAGGTELLFCPLTRWAEAQVDSWHQSVSLAVRMPLSAEEVEQREQTALHSVHVNDNVLLLLLLSSAVPENTRKSKASASCTQHFHPTTVTGFPLIVIRTHFLMLKEKFKNWFFLYFKKFDGFNLNAKQRVWKLFDNERGP